MTEKKFSISPLVWLIGFPIVSFLVIIFLSNGLRELITPEWIDPAYIIIVAWIELILIGVLSIISIFCILILFWLITKYISIDKLEDAFYRLKKD